MESSTCSPLVSNFVGILLLHVGNACMFKSISEGSWGVSVSWESVPLDLDEVSRFALSAVGADLGDATVVIAVRGVLTERNTVNSMKHAFDGLKSKSLNREFM